MQALGLLAKKISYVNQQGVYYSLTEWDIVGGRGDYRDQLSHCISVTEASIHIHLMFYQSLRITAISLKKLQEIIIVFKNIIFKHA